MSDDEPNEITNDEKVTGGACADSVDEVVEIDGFEDPDVFNKRTDRWIEVFRKTKPAPGNEAVLIPGDPEREAESVRIHSGIPLVQAVVDDLLWISKKTGVAFME